MRVASCKPRALCTSPARASLSSLSSSQVVRAVAASKLQLCPTLRVRSGCRTRPPARAARQHVRVQNVVEETGEVDDDGKNKLIVPNVANGFHPACGVP